jgi:predicted dehydrogenase
MLFLDLWKGQMEFHKMSGGHETYPDLEGDQIYPHEAPAMNFIDSILDPTRNQSPASLGVPAMEVIEAACISSAKGQNIYVEDLVGQPK